jgi:integrase/recombinase XerD
MSRRRLPKSFRPAESEALIAAATSARDRLLVLIGLYVGLRVSEILNLEVPDVDLIGAMIAVNRGKGDKDRRCPIPDKLAGPLHDWIGLRQTGWLFESPRKKGARLSCRAVQRMLKRLARDAGLPDWDKARKYHPHAMRHTFATSLLRAGCDVSELQALMGHANLATSATYLSADPFRMKAAVDRLNFGATTPEKPDPKPESPEEPKAA